MLVLKIRYPSISNTQAVRTFRIPSSSTVADATSRVSERGGVQDRSVDSYGLFIPSYLNLNIAGWLPSGSTLEALGLSSGSEIDFRERCGRKINVCDGRVESSMQYSWNDELPVKRNLASLCREMAKQKLLCVMPPSVNKRVSILSKNDLLLNYPLPEDADFVLSIQEGWRFSPDSSDDDIVENVFFYVQTPFCEGEVWKKSASGFRRGWKKLWCVLQKETFQFYADSNDKTPIGGTHIRNLEFCYQSEAIDAHSKKLGHVFKLGTTGVEKVLYFAVSQKSTLMLWIASLDKWLRFREFFKPKAITERGFALSHILSGQIRPNPKAYTGEKDSAIVSPDQHRAESAVVEDAASGGALEVQPNREISVLLLDGSTREMVVDSRLDVYELAYMISEEIRSASAFVMSDEDFGPARTVELLDHQASLASQQIPLSAKLTVRKTGIVDDFVKENDIYDNHFLFVVLPSMSGQVLVRDEANAWREISLRLFGGKICAMSPADNSLVEALVPMTDVLSINHASSDAVEQQLLECAFTITLANNAELLLLANSPDACEEWCELDGWCGFHSKNPLMDPVEEYSWRLYEKGALVENAAQWLGVSSESLGASSAGLPESVSPVMSPRNNAPEGTVEVEPAVADDDDPQDDYEESVEERPPGRLSASESDDMSNVLVSPPDKDLPELPAPQSTAPIAITASTNSTSSTSPSLSSSSGSMLQREGSQPRIKRFDWRKGNSGREKKVVRRRSVEELFLDALEDEAVEDEEQRSVEDDESEPLKISSDDESSLPSHAIMSHAEEDSSVLDIANVLVQEPPRHVSDDKVQDAVSNILAPAAKARPPQDVSRFIRKAYESVEAVKLKVLPDNDPSLYIWKVLHSVNLQKLGYASAQSGEILFFDLRGQEVLRVKHADLPGLSLPASRQGKVQKVLAQMRKSSKRDVVTELRQVYEVDSSVSLRRARDAEFEYRVVVENGAQVGWASRSQLDTMFYDMNGKALGAFPTNLLSPITQEHVTTTRFMPGDLRNLFNTSSDVHVELCPEEDDGPFDYKVALDDGTVVGWGVREAFDFSFSDLQGRHLGKIPLMAMQGLLPPPRDSSGKKRSSSGSGKGSVLGRLVGLDKDQKKSGSLSKASTQAKGMSPEMRSGSQTDLRKGTGGRRLSEWKIRSSVKGSPVNTGSPAGSVPSSPSTSSARKGSVDYTPDGLSPELQGSGYDPSSAHRPMGLAGLLEGVKEKK